MIIKHAKAHEVASCISKVYTLRIDVILLANYFAQQPKNNIWELKVERRNLVIKNVDNPNENLQFEISAIGLDLSYIADEIDPLSALKLYASNSNTKIAIAQNSNKTPHLGK